MKKPALAIAKGDGWRRQSGWLSAARPPDQIGTTGGPTAGGRVPPSYRDRSAMPTTTPSRMPTPKAVASDRPGFSRITSCE
jgi:hypothetical protein